MNRLTADASALVLVDYQGRLMHHIHQGERALAHAVFLAEVAHELSVPVLGTEQNPRGLGPNAEVIRQRCDRTLEKQHFDACEDGLLEALQASRPGGVREVVIAGCEAHVCLMQTALGLMDAGLRVWVVGEACGSRSPEHHALALAQLQQAGATVVASEMVAFGWLRSCTHPRFKAVLGRVKAHDSVLSALSALTELAATPAG